MPSRRSPSTRRRTKCTLTASCFAANLPRGFLSRSSTRSSRTPVTVSWLLLQLSDSALPTGGFAHSSGLEAAAQQRELVTASDLQRFARDALWQAGHFALPL